MINSQPYVVESVVVERAGNKIYALVYVDTEAIRKDGLSISAVADLPEVIRLIVTTDLPAYSRIYKVELVDKPFEKTPKMSIKRFLYK